MSKRISYLIKEYIYIAILICPFFIGYSLGEGIVLDATPLNTYSTPSLPFGIFVVFVSFLFYFTKIEMPIFYIMAILVLLAYLVISFMTPLFVRSIPLFLGMVVPIINYCILTNKIKYNTHDIDYYIILRNVCFAVVWIKMISDVLIFESITTEFIFTEDIAIYNYFDYFPFFYCVTVLFIFEDIIKNNRLTIFSILTIIVCFAATLNAHSRVFQGLIILSPFFLIYFKYVHIKIKTMSYLIIWIVVIATLITGLFFHESVGSDPSLTLRFGHWHEFFVVSSIQTVFVPLFNPYRLSMDSGTTHNEILEIYTLFGVGVVFFMVVFTDIFAKVKNAMKPLSSTVLIILLLGTLIQLNITNPHLGILWSTFIATMSIPKGAKHQMAQQS